MNMSPVPARPLHIPLKLAVLSLGMSQVFGNQAFAQAAPVSQLRTVTVTAPNALSPTEGYSALSSVGATKTDTALNEVPQSVSVVTRQQIEDQRPRTVAEALRYTPGVFTGAAGSTTRYDYIVLRGFSDHPTANVFLDGLRLIGDPDGYNTVQMDPAVVERLDVIRGPASVTYGQAAPGGLVAITTKRPRQEAQRQLELNIGTRQQRSLMFDTTGAVAGRPDMSYRLIVKGAGADQQQRGAETERYVVAPSFQWNLSDRTSLLLQAYWQNEPKTGYHGALPYEGSAVPHNGRYISRRFNESSPQDDMHRRQQFVGYQLDHAFTPDWRVQQKYRYQKSETDVRQFSQYGWVSDTSDDVYRSYARSHEDSSAHIIDTALLGRVRTGALTHDLMFGVDYQRSGNDGYNSYQYLTTALNTRNPVYDDSGAFVVPTFFNRDREQTGLYVQDQVSVGKWRLTAGLRHDSAEVSDRNPELGTTSKWSGSQLTTRLGAVYLADNGLAPYASYSEGFDPSMAYAVDADGNVLEPLESRQYELGVRYHPPGRDMQLAAALYHLEQKNLAQYNLQTFSYDPIGEVRSRGIELEAQARLTPRLSLLAGYTFSDMEVTAGQYEGNAPYLAPRHKASLWLSYAMDAGLTLGGGVRHTSSLWADSDNTAKVAGVTVADVSLRYDLARLNPSMKGASVQLNVNNLFDKKYVASCYSLVACYYGEERNVNATLSYKW